MKLLTVTTSGKWVSDKIYSDYTGVPRQTLSNWRYRDRLAGRTEPLPGYPRYTRYGRAIRYWLPTNDGGRAA